MQERLIEQHKFTNIMFLQSRFPERGSPFSSPIYSSFSFQKSLSISKFEKTFEAIKKKDCKETLRRYSFRKPKIHASPSEQVSSISISDSEEDDLQQ